MTETELEKRKERAKTEPLIISQTEEGYRVYSPANPTKFHLVTDIAESPCCSCPDYQLNKGDPEWRCKHILAVLDLAERAGAKTAANNKGGSDEPEETPATEPSPTLPDAGDTERPPPGPYQMAVKRSVSPDGHIDSVRVEFICSVVDMTDEEISTQAMRILYLQSEITGGFMERNGKEKKKPEPPPANYQDGAIPAQLLSVGGMAGKWGGRRLFINVAANGQTLKLFGDQKQLAQYIVWAGYPDMGERIKEGFSLNLPCRVVTKRSDDGKYVNIDRVFPIEALRFNRKPAK